MKKRAIMTPDKFCTAGQVIPCVGFSSGCPESTSTDGEHRNMAPSKVLNLPLPAKILAGKFASTPQNVIPIAKKGLNNYNEIEWVEKTDTNSQVHFPSENV